MVLAAAAADTAAAEVEAAPDPVFDLAFRVGEDLVVEWTDLGRPPPM